MKGSRCARTRRSSNAFWKQCLTAWRGWIQLRFVNRQMESMFGYERGDMVGLPIETLVPESLREVHSGHREGCNDAPLQRPMGRDLILSAQRRSGTQFPVYIALSHSDTADGPLAITAVRGMTVL